MELVARHDVAWAKNWQANSTSFGNCLRRSKVAGGCSRPRKRSTSKRRSTSAPFLASSGRRGVRAGKPDGQLAYANIALTHHRALDDPMGTAHAQGFAGHALVYTGQRDRASRCSTKRSRRQKNRRPPSRRIHHCVAWARRCRHEDYAAANGARRKWCRSLRRWSDLARGGGRKGPRAVRVSSG